MHIDTPECLILSFSLCHLSTFFISHELDFRSGDSISGHSSSDSAFAGDHLGSADPLTSNDHRVGGRGGGGGGGGGVNGGSRTRRRGLDGGKKEGGDNDEEEEEEGDVEEEEDEENALTSKQMKNKLAQLEKDLT